MRGLPGGGDMSNLSDLKDKFNRAGGAQILSQYSREHVLGYALLQTALQS